jgi:pimeloyl-ACP methyl ester carboxylesterase
MPKDYPNDGLQHLVSRGTAIAYRRRAAPAAEGLPLVLIHGAASNMSRWSEFAGLTALAMSHDLLRLDLRGHAGSLYRGPVSLEIWCGDIAALLRREGYERAILVGHCLGANIAALFADRYPQHTAGLVLVEPMPCEALRDKLRRLRTLAPLLRAVIAAVGMCNRLGLYRRHLQPLDLPALDAELRAHLGTPDETAFLKRRYASPWQDLKTLPSAILLQDLLEVLRPLPWERIRVPALVLLSTGQGFVDPGITRTLMARLPLAEVETLEAEHWIPAEQPQAMRAAIERWVQGRDWKGD